MASLSTLLPGVSLEEVTSIAAYTGGFSEQQLRGFAASYLEQRKSTSTAIWILALCGWFGGHYYYLGDVGKGIIFTVTLSVAGVMWFVDILRIKKLVIAANSNLARQITAGMR